MTKVLCRANQLSYHLGNATILSNISLEVRSGEILCILGSNGCGKTTLLRCLAGLLHPSMGVVRRYCLRVGYTSHQPLLYGKLTIQQNLEFFARLERVSPQRLHEKIALWRLADHRNKFVDQLSQGLKTRVALCRLFSGSADLLILDEPSAALDDEATQILITELATRINRGIGSNLAEAGVVITTHDTARILPCVDTIAVVHNGVLRGIGPKSEVKELLELYRSLNR